MGHWTHKPQTGIEPGLFNKQLPACKDCLVPSMTKNLVFLYHQALPPCVTWSPWATCCPSRLSQGLRHAIRLAWLNGFINWRRRPPKPTNLPLINSAPEWDSSVWNFFGVSTHYVNRTQTLIIINIPTDVPALLIKMSVGTVVATQSMAFL